MNSGARKYNQFLNGNSLISYFDLTLQGKFVDIKGVIISLRRHKRMVKKKDSTTNNGSQNTEHWILNKNTNLTKITGRTIISRKPWLVVVHLCAKGFDFASVFYWYWGLDLFRRCGILVAFFFFLGNIKYIWIYQRLASLIYHIVSVVVWKVSYW